MSHPILERIASTITNSISVANFSEDDRTARLRSVVSDVLHGSLSFEDLRLMLRVADVGIADAAVKKEEADPRLVKTFKAVMAASADEGSEEMSDEEVNRLFEQMGRHLVFSHSGADNKSYPLPSTEQSTGTLAWISLAAPAIKTLRNGGVLAIDELDASLHPQLAQVIVMMFKDKALNKNRAQLIFTTHDTYFLSPISEITLSAEEVWFVEKGADGASDVFSLAEFNPRGDHNFSKRYLEGRYGAVPAVAPSFLASLAERPSEINKVEIDTMADDEGRESN